MRALHVRRAPGVARAELNGIRPSGTLRIPIENLLAIGGERPLLQSTLQLGLGQPAVPGHLIRIGGDDLRKDGIAHPEPVRAESAPVEELEPKAHGRRRSQLLTELASSRLLIGLPDSGGAADPEFVVPWETGQLLCAPMDQETVLPITAHHYGNSVQPALPNGLPPTDHSQHTVLSIHSFHEFIHDAHHRRAH